MSCPVRNLMCCRCAWRCARVIYCVFNVGKSADCSCKSTFLPRVREAGRGSRSRLGPDAATPAVRRRRRVTRPRAQHVRVSGVRRVERARRTLVSGETNGEKTTAVRRATARTCRSRRARADGGGWSSQSTVKRARSRLVYVSTHTSGSTHISCERGKYNSAAGRGHRHHTSVSRATHHRDRQPTGAIRAGWCR